MTLENCKKYLEEAEEQDKQFWIDRIARKLSQRRLRKKVKKEVKEIKEVKE